MNKKKTAVFALTASAFTLAVGIPLSKQIIAQDMPGMSASATPSQLPGQTPSPSASPSQTSSPGVSGTQIWAFQLSPLNSAYNGQAASGSGEVVIDKDRFSASLSGQGVSPDSIHMADIHKGDRCATLADDANGDGVVDAVEASAAAGGILIPFDGDLSTFAGGSDYNPTSDSIGNIAYAGSGSLASLLSDLHRAAVDPASGAVTLASGEDLNLDNAIVELRGVDPSAQLPSTVQSVTGQSANQSLPIACGQLVRVSPAQVQATATPTATATPSATPSASPSVEVSPSPSPSATP